VTTVPRTRTRRRGGAPAGLTEADAVKRYTVAALNLELAEQRVVDGARRDFRESVGDLEQRLLDPGWRRFAIITEQEFTDEGRDQLRSVCRLMAIANPLIKRGLSLRSAYVHGQGVQFTARANGTEDDEQDVQGVVSAHVQDEGNQRSWYGPAARDRLERSLGTDGELFPALFTRPLTGEIQVRVLPADEICEIICNPEDAGEEWLYRRRWTETSYMNGEGVPTSTTRERLYPAVNYRPTVRAKRLGAIDIAWDSPVLHIDVNRPEHWQHGIPDVYSAINWARAYKVYLEQWATLMSALSRYAWRTTAGNTKQAKQVRSAVQAASPRNAADTDPRSIGQLAVTEDGRTLEAIPKSGATIDSESARPLAMMVAAALDVPVTMLLGDPGQTGARAVAETLDWPTELAMRQRRDVWTAADLRIFRYTIAESVRAPKGPIKGKIIRDKFRDREIVKLAGETDDTIDVVWPPLDKVDPKALIDAIVSAAGTGTLPPEEILRMLLSALGVREADKIIEKLIIDGEFQWPSQPGAGQPGQPGTGAPGQPGADPAAGGAATPADAFSDVDWGLFGGSGGAANPDGQQPDAPTAPGAPGQQQPPAPGAPAAPAQPAPAAPAGNPDATAPADAEQFDVAKFKPTAGGA
jgi:hypothetical protein